jgi:hypothetical protein
VTDVTADLSLAFTVAAGFDFLLFIPTGSYIITSTVVVSSPLPLFPGHTFRHFDQISELKIMIIVTTDS